MLRRSTKVTILRDKLVIKAIESDGLTSVLVNIRLVAWEMTIVVDGLQSHKRLNVLVLRRYHLILLICCRKLLRVVCSLESAGGCPTVDLIGIHV